MVALWPLLVILTILENEQDEQGCTLEVCVLGDRQSRSSIKLFHTVDSSWNVAPGRPVLVILKSITMCHKLRAIQGHSSGEKWDGKLHS